MKTLVHGLIRFYQLALSPFLGKNCRFHPTCSEYMKLAIDKYGFKGFVMGCKRIAKCHPFSKGGVDPLE